MTSYSRPISVMYSLTNFKGEFDLGNNVIGYILMVHFEASSRRYRHR